MRICLFVDATRIFRWHFWLAEALTRDCHCQVVVEYSPEHRSLPSCCSLLFVLERLVYGLASESAIDPAGALIGPFLSASSRTLEPFDVVIDLAGCGSRLPAARRILAPFFDGLTSEIGAISCLVARQMPIVQVTDSAALGRAWTARPAAVDRGVFTLSLDNILSAAVYLLKSAVLSAEHPALLQEAPGGPPMAEQRPRLGTGVILQAGATVTEKAMRLLNMLVTGGRSWAVGWRPAVSRTLLVERKAIFNVLRDDGHRYYADPFVFHWRNRTFLFVEEYAYSTRRGCISVSEIRADGPTTPRPVLEEPHHLSYPFVFEQDGQIWMIPESGAARGVYLYRAEAFPFKWKREACLISDTEAYDATLVHHDQWLWLFVCERAWSSSSWDALTVFRSDRLAGEWQPHRYNPVLLDASTSRPAGAIFNWKGDQLRPAQDCSGGYGGAVSLCRIDALSPVAFKQTIIGRIHCGPYGCHTYNHDQIELIDTFAPRGLDNITAFYDAWPAVKQRWTKGAEREPSSEMAT